MLFKSLARVLVITLSVALAGCGGGGSSNNSGGGGGGTPSLTTITVSPLGPAVSVGQTVSLSASGAYSDGSTKDLTSSATWSSSDSSKATVSAGAVKGVAPGVVTITVTQNGKTASTALNVTNQALSNSTLSGSYVFELEGVDSSGPQFVVGTFTADGNGKITSGEADVNTAAGVQSQGSISGTYDVFADGRGDARLSIGSSNASFRFIVSSDGSRGRLIEFDNAATVLGSFEKQVTTALTSNAYVFRMRGVDAAGNEQGQIGRFSVASNNLTGTIDVNDKGANSNGSAGKGVPLTGSVTAPDSKGRGTAVLTYALQSGSVTAHFAYYQGSSANGTTVYLMQTDARNNGAVSGVAEQQANLTLSAGTFVFRTGHAASVQSGTFELMGQLNIPLAGAVTGVQNEDLNNTSVQISNGSFTVDPTTGRGTLNEFISASANLYRTFTIYVVSGDTFYLLEQTCQTCAGTAFRASLGEARMQTSQNLSAQGPLAFSVGELGESNMLILGQMTVDASGNVSGIEDLVDNKKTPVIQSLAFTGSLSPQSPVSFNPSPNLGPDHFIYYTVGSGKGLILGVLPDVDGQVEPQ